LLACPIVGEEANHLTFTKQALAPLPSSLLSLSLAVRTLANFIFFMRRFSAFPNRASWSAVVPRKKPELIFTFGWFLSCPLQNVPSKMCPALSLYCLALYWQWCVE